MKNALIIVAAMVFGSPMYGQEKSNSSFVQDDFKNPPAQYRPMPFWHINGEMTESGILEQMKEAKDVNFSGLAILPVHSTQPEFLSEAYFKKYSFLLENAQKLGMQVILYDDTGFPSGTAGGRIERDYPQYLRKSLEKIEYDVSGLPYWKSKVPEGKLMAVVGMNMKTLERVDLSSFINSDILSWQVPGRENWRVMFFMSTTATFWKSHMPVDYMDTTAVNQFINLTYEEYAKRYQSYIGNTIELSFFDDVGFLRRERTWTGGFNEKFTDLNGFDPTLYYPALWYDIGEETEASRVAFFNTRSELLAEGYPKMVTQWTKAHGLKNTGHPPGNYGIQPVDMHGDIFKYYRYTDLPLADAIIDYGNGLDGFKLISSAADYYDRPVVSTEVYGAFNEKIVDVNMLYRTIMELFVRGINFVVPHGMWYNPEKMGIPPLISPKSEKLAPALPAYSNYVGRSCYLLQGGRKVTDIAILYPIASLQAEYYFDAPENKRAGSWAYPEADYQKVGSILTNQIHRDFTFLHPEFLASDKYTVQKSNLRLENEENYQDYKVLIIPGGKTISIKALEKIKDFYDKGGKVLATTLLPSIAAEMGNNPQVVKIIKEMFGENPSQKAEVQTNAKGGGALFVQIPTGENLDEALDEFLAYKDVSFVDNSDVSGKLGTFSYLHKIKDGKDIYFFANSSDQAIRTEVLLKGKVDFEEWDPNSGSITSSQDTNYIKKDGQTYTRASLVLPPVKSTFWVEK